MCIITIIYLNIFYLQYSSSGVRRSMLSKACGQVTRVALILHTIQNAIASSQATESNPVIETLNPNEITVTAMQYAVDILEYCLEHKYALVKISMMTRYMILHKI